MVALIFLIFNLVASLFKSKSRLEAENTALRHQLTVLQRKIRGRVQFTNSDRVFSSARSQPASKVVAAPIAVCNWDSTMPPGIPPTAIPTSHLIFSFRLDLSRSRSSAILR
jgi:hypothetical protein